MKSLFYFLGATAIASASEKTIVTFDGAEVSETGREGGGERERERESARARFYPLLTHIWLMN